jgi:DNA-binding CsgD family transcriptional regulator
VYVACMTTRTSPLTDREREVLLAASRGWTLEHAAA